MGGCVQCMLSHYVVKVDSKLCYDALAVDDHYLTAFFSPFSRLIQRWVENIIEAVKAASKTALSAEKIRPHMDSLTMQLLALSKLAQLCKLFNLIGCPCDWSFNDVCQITSLCSMCT